MGKEDQYTTFVGEAGEAVVGAAAGAGGGWKSEVQKQSFEHKKPRNGCSVSGLDDLTNVNSRSIEAFG